VPVRPVASYRKLDPLAIHRTVDLLVQRIAERFPDRGILGVAREVAQVARQADENVERAARPDISLRLLVAALIVLMLGTEFALGAWLISRREESNWLDYLQGADASLNIVILSAGAVYFLVSYEKRMKRRRILASLQELRALAHVVEMHQLTKDPARLFPERLRTPSSPELGLTAELLGCYLDYCTELLAIIGNIAALYAQGDDDQVTLDSADAIAALCTGISGRIWQKMQILERAMPAKAEPRVSGGIESFVEPAYAATVPKPSE